jgi:hypothetical protein
MSDHLLDLLNRQRLKRRHPAGNDLRQHCSGYIQITGGHRPFLSRQSFYPEELTKEKSDNSALCIRRFDCHQLLLRHHPGIIGRTANPSRLCGREQWLDFLGRDWFNLRLSKSTVNHFERRHGRRSNFDSD